MSGFIATPSMRDIDGLTQAIATLGEEINYLHDRIDHLIRQSGIEIGLLDARSRGVLFRDDRDKVYELAKKRFWAADDAAAQNHNREPRER